ncbi:hypothetical protein SAMN06264365_1551, partial [Actinoplanes regularis]
AAARTHRHLPSGTRSAPLGPVGARSEITHLPRIALSCGGPDTGASRGPHVLFDLQVHEVAGEFEVGPEPAGAPVRLMAVTTRLRLSSVLVLTSLVTLMSACAASTSPSTARSDGNFRIEASSPAKTSAPGEAAAVWFLKPDQSLKETSTRFTAFVSRLGCNGGITGQVLAPEIHMHQSEVVVTFMVAPRQPAGARCPGNDPVSYEVNLGEPLQGRALVDGQCRPGGEAVGTSLCAPDATRFRP